MVDKIKYSYYEIHQLCMNNGQKLKREFKPDVILAIGGGGLIPSRILSNSLNVPIYVVSLSTYDEENNAIDVPRVIQWMDFSELKNKKILIVDEVDDTRKTLEFVINKLTIEEKISDLNLGVFVLHNKIKNKTINRHDLNISYYCSGENVNDICIVYPWD